MKFSIRDLLLVTVIVGLSLAWWGESIYRKTSESEKWRGRAELLKETLEKTGRKVTWDERQMVIFPKQ